MASEKQKVLDWFYRAEYTVGVIEFDEILAKAVRDALGKSQVDAELFSNRNALRYWNWLLAQIDDDMQKGLTPVFNIRNDRVRRVHWYATDSTVHLSAEENRKAELIKSRAHMLRKIDNLTDRQYEALGCVISRLSGAKDVFLTPSSDEGGVDFFASINTPAINHIFFGGTGSIRIIGQCKKYGDRTKVDRVKEFITTINAVKHQDPAVERHVPSWFRAASGPIVGWIIAHNGFQSGAGSTANHHGILLSDSRDLAEIAALSQDINEADACDVRANHLYDIVISTLDEFI